MIEKDIETKLVNKIKGLGFNYLDVVGLWQPTMNGIVKGIEKSKTPCALIVKIPPKQFDTFGISEVSMDIQLILSVRIDMCVTGKEMLEVSSAISNLLKEWNMVQCGDELTDFHVDGFYAGGIQVNNGAGPELDKNTFSWTVVWNINLRGTVVSENDNNN